MWYEFTTTEELKMIPKLEELTHPMQPLGMDDNDTLRFKGNAIVNTLLDTGKLDMNDIAGMPFSKEDRVQFAQLIGYSLCGFGELQSYVSDDDYNQAEERMAKTGSSSQQARIDSLEDSLKDSLKTLRTGLRDVAVTAFGVHPDDLEI